MKQNQSVRLLGGRRRVDLGWNIVFHLGQRLLGDGLKLLFHNLGIRSSRIMDAPDTTAFHDLTNAGSIGLGDRSTFSLAAGLRSFNFNRRFIIRTWGNAGNLNGRSSAVLAMVDGDIVLLGSNDRFISTFGRAAEGFGGGSERSKDLRDSTNNRAHFDGLNPARNVRNESLDSV